MSKLRDLFERFVVYCVVGWLYESIWCVMIDENCEFIDRGFLQGPWIPIYGISMTLILLVIDKLRVKEPFLIFLLGASISTVSELIGSYFLEAVCGEFLWDYSGMFMNFEGRIAVKPAIMFGLLVMLGALSLKPRMEKLQSRLSGSVVRNVFTCFVAVLFAVDVIVSFKAVL